MPVRSINAMVFTLALLSAQAASAVTTISTSAYALFSNVRALSTVGVVVGPIAPTSGTASPAYDATNQVVDLTADIDLGVLALVRVGLALDTGVLSSRSTANGLLPGDTTTGSATANVEDATVDLFTTVQSIIPFVPDVTTTFLGIGADSITSSASVTRTGATTASFAGNSTLTNLDLLVLSLLQFNLGASGAVAANTTLLDIPGLTIILNEQILDTNGLEQSITVNALRASFDDIILGGQIIVGDLIISSSRAEIRFEPGDPGVPEPAIWLQLITGFGLAGTAVRRRRAAALA